jgi:hypothetical protein
MFNRIRPHWLALLGAALLVALSVSSAFGAKPWSDERPNPGQQVSEFVHSLFSGDQEDQDDSTDEETTDEDAGEESDEDSDEITDEETGDEETADEDSESGQPDNHGACVSAVATGGDVGGVHDNHGGAVSEAARVTCWGEDGDEESSDGEVVHGNSANAHDKGDGQGHGNGHGHGGNH